MNHTSTATPVSTPAPARSLSYQELDILHSLRGFCAFYVVIFHAKFLLWSGGQQYLQAFPRTQWGSTDYASFALDMFSAAGYEMVIFFFVLSGFFIRYAQLRKHRAAGAFYLNRIVRIYPPFLVSLVLAAAVLTVVATQVPQVLNPGLGRELNATLAEAWQELRAFDAGGLVRALLFLKLGLHYLGDNVVYWSLLPEALFYLLIPVAFRYVRWYYLLSAALFGVGLVLSWRGVPQNDLLRFALSYNVYFALGVGLYDVVVRTDWVERVRRIPRFITLPGLGGMLLALVGLSLLKWTVAATVLSGVLAVLAVLVLLAGHVSRQNLLVRGLHKLGLFSFSLYLYHYPLLLLCYAALVKFTGKLFIYERVYWLAVPLVTLVCYGLYWITERVSVNYFRKV
ncbi:acyltransferase family protein [Hymenobacter sp. B81]|uniref:acyltransferase family protein n=1 Tax=Hymenobacter sp. B81 TaxID=3344878 RepID=UPI0037DDAF45